MVLLGLDGWMVGYLTDTKSVQTAALCGRIWWHWARLVNFKLKGDC